MSKYVGNHSCKECLNQPRCQILPCNHTSCEWHNEGDGKCGICGEEARTISEINPDRSTDPVLEKNYSWSIDQTRKLFSMPEFDIRRDSTVDVEKTRKDNDKTPTPASMRAGKTSSKTNNPDTTSSSNTGSSQSRYVPPQLRGNPSEEKRPLSSISNKSFASQLPSTPKQTNANTSSRSSSMSSIMSSTYRFGPGQLNNQFATYDPFSDAAASRQGPGYIPNADAARRAPYQGGNNNSFRGFTPSNQLVSSDSFTSARIPAADGSTSRSKQLTAFIMSGATDDPTDPDYGNPGRSKKLPKEDPLTVPKTPMPKGKVAPSSSNDMVAYNENESHTKGNASVYLGKGSVPPPGWLSQTTVCYTPKVEEVLAVLPMIEACRAAKPSTAGVIKITNIPYACSRAEIVAFLGKNAQILNQPASSSSHYAVHIMMDKPTAKTMDAFVEVKSSKEAVLITSQFGRRTRHGGHIKLGDRDVELAMVSQADFMATLFPRAKNVVWHGPVPVVSDDREELYPGQFSSGFQGFLQDEELHMMKKHAETPERSPFAARVLIRTYEAMITTLHKYPWHAVDHILLEERHLIFETTYRTIRALIDFLNNKQGKFGGTDRTHPTIGTLQELVIAALTCPGFSEGHKAAIVLQITYSNYRNVMDFRSMNFRVGGIDNYSKDWPFHALVKKPGVDDRLIKYIAGLFRNATLSTSQLSVEELKNLRSSNAQPPMFGKVKVDHKDVKTLGDLGRVELKAVEDTLARVLARDRSRSSHPGRKSS